MNQQEQIRNVLGLCARNQGHDRMYELLEKSLTTYTDHEFSWQELIIRAEEQGVAPLLYKHLTTLDFTLPGGQHRILRSLYQRCRRANQIRNRVISEILASFQKQGVDVLPIKGIALANIIYDSPGLRPMRDIDLLVRRQDLESVSTILIEHGFRQETDHGIPHDYYHLPPLHKEVDGLPLNIEIHHELLPREATYPVWTYESFQHQTLPFTIDGIPAVTIRPERNLYYLYLHGIKAPLTYEPFRLIHVADLISLTEAELERICWEKVSSDFPDCRAILSRLHFISPWPEQVTKKLRLDLTHPPGRTPLPYQGWPLRKIKKTPVAGLPALIRETIYPPQWWLQVYYGKIKGSSYFKIRLFEHPRTIWRWVKTYILARFNKR